MKKPTVYLETSTISAFWYEGANVAMLARRLRTRDWWEHERRHFALWTSAVVEAELAAGHYPRQVECSKMVRRLRYFISTKAARDLQEEIMRRGLVPPNKNADAAHLAISATQGVDFVLSWNYAHIANPIAQARLAKLCEEVDLVVPLLVSPESIPQVRLGQSIRR